MMPVVDLEDLRFLVVVLCLVLAGAGVVVALLAGPHLAHRCRDEGAGFRWVKR